MKGKRQERCPGVLPKQLEEASDVSGGREEW